MSVPRVFRERLLICICASLPFAAWSGSSMVLGKLPVPGCPTRLDKGLLRLQ